MKLTYYKVKCQNDNDVYSMREKTKKAIFERLKAEYDPSKLDWFNDKYADYSTKKIYILKIQINYSDGFDLMDQLRGGEWDAEESIKEYMYEVDYFSN